MAYRLSAARRTVLVGQSSTNGGDSLHWERLSFSDKPTKAFAAEIVGGHMLADGLAVALAINLNIGRSDPPEYVKYPIRRPSFRGCGPLYSEVYKKNSSVFMLPVSGHRYNAEISAGSLMPLESKRIAALLLTKPDEAAWLDAIEVQNILQKKTPATARRQATLIRKRLLTLEKQAWEMLATRESEVVNQLLLAASIKHSQLLGDFLRVVYAQRLRGLEGTLAANNWHDFLAEIAHHDASVSGWSESTKAKLFQVIVRILAEAKFLVSARSMRITPQALHPDVARYLRKHHEAYVLECLERTP